MVCEAELALTELSGQMQCQIDPHSPARTWDCRKEEKALVIRPVPSNKEVMKIATTDTKDLPSAQLARRLASKWPRPKWHPPWHCYRVISGHLGYCSTSSSALFLVCSQHQRLARWFCLGKDGSSISPAGYTAFQVFKTKTIRCLEVLIAKD